MVYYTNMTLKTKRFINRIQAIVLIPLMLLSPVQTVFAATDPAVVEKSIFEATSLLESAITNSLEGAEMRIKEEIVKKNLDYHLTMESFHRCENPYLDADYPAMISAYIVAAESAEKSRMDTLFYGLPFIREKLVITYAWEYEPVAVDEYGETEEGSGKYEKTGTVLIDSPQTVQDFKKTADGFFIPCGTKDINPEKKLIRYGEVSLEGLTPEDILDFFDLDTEKYLLSAQEKKEKFERLINPNGLQESVFLNARHEDLLDEKTRAYITGLLADEDLDLSRKQLIDRAASLIGLVPYEWGGKAEKPGYDTSWWTIDGTGRQKGLDCSGFVQWALMSAGFDESVWKNMVSTGAILSHTASITEEELVPGDLGLLNNGQGINHVGIYLGNGMWIHCSSGERTVVAEKTGMFRIYKRLPETDGVENLIREVPQDVPTVRNRTDMEPAQEQPEEEEERINETEESVTVYRSECPFTDSEIYLAAQLVYNEACGEGLNGWAAVAEVLLNRVKSGQFPNTIKDVIYQEGQFSDSDLIETREPPEEMVLAVKDVLSGNMKVLNDSDILYFRNAGGDEGNWGTHAFFATVNSHQFYRQ